MVVNQGTPRDRRCVRYINSMNNMRPLSYGNYANSYDTFTLHPIDISPLLNLMFIGQIKNCSLEKTLARRI